jgi:hypothetical protein
MEASLERRIWIPFLSLLTSFILHPLNTTCKIIEHLIVFHDGYL